VRFTRAPSTLSHSIRRALHLHAVDRLSLDSVCAPPARRQPYFARLYHDSGYRRSPSLTVSVDDAANLLTNYQMLRATRYLLPVSNCSPFIFAGLGKEWV
jgi:hypothetical protein